MKGLKKLTLASAIAVAPFASQALEALDDATMGDVTGQAGVTVELTIGGSGISVGEIECTDECSVSIQNVTVNNVTQLTQTIDVDGEGNLVMGTTPVSGIQLAVGDTAADTSGQYSAVALRSTAGETTELVNNLNMTVNLGSSTTTVMNLAAAGNSAPAGPGGPGGAVTQALAAGFSPEAFQSSVAIRSTSSLEITDLDVGAFGYTAAQAGTRVTDLKAAIAANDANSADALAVYNEAVVSAGGAAYADVATFNGTADTSTSDGQATAAFANGSAIQINDVKFYGTGGEGTAATIDQVVWAQGGSSANGGGVYIQMGQIAGTLEVGGIVLGGESIGSVKVSNLNLAGMTQRIYGHN